MNSIARAKRIVPMLVILPILGSCGDGNGGDGLTNLDWDPPQTHHLKAITLAPGERINLDALVLHLGSNTYVIPGGLTWVTSDEEVVRYLGNGWIEALEPGEANLTADLGGGRSVKAMVVVAKDGGRLVVF